MSERKMKLRGIIKWYPYASINDPLSFQEEINAYNNIKEKPHLSEHQLDEMNYVLLDAYNHKRAVYISYFQNNQIQTIIGEVSKLDTIELFVIINKHKIILNEISYIEYADAAK